MSNYFESYSFEVGSTDPHSSKTTYSFRGPKEYIDRLKEKPLQVTNSYNLAGWSIQSIGYGNGVLKTIASKMIGTRTMKIETIVSNKLPKFKMIELESDYDPYNPIGNAVSFVEVYNKEGKTDPEFTKIDELQEHPYERKFGNSSIMAIADFLRDPEFEKILPKIGDVE